MAAARRALDGFEELLDLRVFYDASLCVSELVTNAVLHAEIAPDDVLALEVSIENDRLTVSVIDTGPGFQPDSPPRSGDESGWGLYIVERLSDRWGVERTDQTRVWFEMGVHAGVEAEAEAERARGERARPEPAQRTGDDAHAGIRRRAVRRLKMRPQTTP